jgi:transcriptional regulator with XRE-family HTH domain
MNESSKKLGGNMKRIRLQKGMTQGDICRKLDLDRAYISHLESGKKNPTLATIEKIAKTLNVSIADLLT